MATSRIESKETEKKSEKTTTVTVDDMVEHITTLLGIKEDDPRVILYREKTDAYLAKSKDLTPLERHVYSFANEDKTFSSKSIRQGLTRMHGVDPIKKCLPISYFNASHSTDGYCPTLRGMFAPDKNHTFGKYLHMGTSRSWNVNGLVEPGRYDAFEKAVADEKGHVPASKLYAYLNQCYQTDPIEPGTNRTRGISLVFWPPVQASAASQAWDEVFNLLACGWNTVDTPTGAQYEAYLTPVVTRAFFQDSTLAFLLAECALLPVSKPDLTQKAKLSL